MSELATGSMSLEEEQPLIPAAEPVAETSSTEEAEPEGTIVNPGGEKLVPLGALAGAREKARSEREARERVEAELAALKPKAEKFDQVAQEWQAVQPLIQSVKNGTYQPRPAAPAPAGPLSEAEAVEYAKDLDLYKPDGTPDVARAQRLAARTEALADRRAQQHLAPLQHQSASQASARNLAEVAAWKDPSGMQVDPSILQDIWSKMPPELTAQPDVAAVMYRVALAETLLQGKGKTPIAAPKPVQHTESLGSPAPAADGLTSIDRRFIEAADIKPDTFTKTASRYKPGERNSLE